MMMYSWFQFNSSTSTYVIIYVIYYYILLDKNAYAYNNFIQILVIFFFTMNFK